MFFNIEYSMSFSHINLRLLWICELICTPSHNVLMFSVRVCLLDGWTDWMARAVNFVHSILQSQKLRFLRPLNRLELMSLNVVARCLCQFVSIQFSYCFDGDVCVHAFTVSILPMIAQWLQRIELKNVNKKIWVWGEENNNNGNSNSVKSWKVEKVSLMHRRIWKFIHSLYISYQRKYRN